VQNYGIPLRGMDLYDFKFSTVILHFAAPAKATLQALRAGDLHFTLSNMKTMKIVNKKTGFTLIELIVVIAIIGILSTIVMVSLNTARGKARDARRISDIRQLQLALQMYYDINGAYPTTTEGLVKLTTPTAYITAVPVDPQNSSAYSYCAPATLGYHLGSPNVESRSTALDSDADVISDGCTSGSFSGADGSGPYVYDVTP